MFAAKEQNFKICNFSTRSLCVTLSQPIMIPNNFQFFESIPLLYTEMLISETAVINIYIYIHSLVSVTLSPPCGYRCVAASWMTVFVLRAPPPLQCALLRRCCVSVSVTDRRRSAAS
jgi:hypothetical protein